MCNKYKIFLIKMCLRRLLKFSELVKKTNTSVTFYFSCIHIHKYRTPDPVFDELKINNGPNFTYLQRIK